MKQTRQPSPGAALLIGLLFIACGIFPMLAAFDIGPLGREDINGPAWLGFVAGGCFVAAGMAVIAGPRAPQLTRLFGIATLAALAVLGNWIAFGIGERACAGSISLPWLWGDGEWSGLACRIPFGFGALVMNAFLCWMIVETLQRALGGPPRLARLLKAAEWLVLASLAPILLPMVIVLVAGSALGVIKARLFTGAWPRNEAFIVRQKAKGLLRRIGRKPPDQSK